MIIDLEARGTDKKNPTLILWTNKADTLEELHQLDNTAHCGCIRQEDVGLVVARKPSMNGVAGTETDQLLLLCGEYLGWNSAHWFKRVAP